MTENTPDCPRCGQGWILQMRVRQTNERLQVCIECEATWPAGAQPTLKGFSDLWNHLA